MHNQNGCRSTGCSGSHGAIYARKGDLGGGDSSSAFNESWGVANGYGMIGMLQLANCNK